MPQLIAMIIVVVGAIIYMFQTFGGTGDTIKGIAQKTSIITELNNLKLGLRLAAQSKQIMSEGSVAGEDGASEDASLNLLGLAELGYFAEQINEKIIEMSKEETNTQYNYQDNTYNLISFGGIHGAVRMRLMHVKAGYVPGILVIIGEDLQDNADFLESQIAHDLKSIANIDRTAQEEYDVPKEFPATEKDRVPPSVAGKMKGGVDLAKDGRFAVYFKDFSAAEVVVGKRN